MLAVRRVVLHLTGRQRHTSFCWRNVKRLGALT